MAESMDMDQLQAMIVQTNSIAWVSLLMWNVFASGMTLTAYLASLPTSPTGLSSGSIWRNVAANNLNWVP